MADTNINDRNEYRADDPLISKFTGRWSPWIIIMLPGPENESIKERGFEKRATQKFPELEGYKIGKEEWRLYIPDKKGVYELGIYNKHQETKWVNVVYIGKSDSLITRLHQHCTGEGHKVEEINEALDKGFEIRARVLCAHHNDTWESKFLNQYEYQWNKQKPKKAPTPVSSGSSSDYDEERSQRSRCRNSIRFSHCLFLKWEKQWSDWFPIIVPSDAGGRWDNGSSLSLEFVKSILHNCSGGIYEVSACRMVQDEDREVRVNRVIFVGMANENKAGHALQKRITKICSNGYTPSLKKKIYDAISNENWIEARVLKLPKKEIGQAIKDVRKKYKYP